MDPHHAITVDPAIPLIRFTLAGFFDEASLARFVADREVAFQALTRPVGEMLCLVDVSRCRLQSQEVFGAFQALVRQAERRTKRMAFVIGSSLARMQVRRLVEGRDDVAFFGDEGAALAWLREPVPA